MIFKRMYRFATMPLYLASSLMIFTMTTSCAHAGEPIQSGATRAATGAIAVRLVKTAAGGFQLLRDGKPYPIKGAGGSASLEKLKAAGGNSVRTWGADDIGTQLDEAQRLGLTVCVGIWFGHKEHGFKYDDPKQVAEQLERVRTAVTKYKNHPAVLMWALGNEMEGYDKGDDPAIWKAVQDAAHLVKQLDPNHPTATVIAEIGGNRVEAIHRYCPDIDIIGINSYAGAASLPTRYKTAGGTKPFMVTEFGPPGTWESGKNSWGAVPELSSTEKADAYRKAYEGAIKNQPLCLGGYAFTWGNKQEATATWFGMLLPDGSKLGAVDAMTEEWTGKPPANRCPEISSLIQTGPDRVQPGATLKANLEAKDPEGKPIKVRWVLQQDPMAESLNGDTQAVPPTYPEAIVRSSDHDIELKMPEKGGAYRLFAFVSDGEGSAATANLPLFVDGKASAGSAETGAKAKLPLVLYSEAKTPNAPYIASGWMGNAGSIRMDENWTNNAHTGESCLRFEYIAPGEWGGVVWQNPANDWGDQKGGWDVTGATKLTFWARGDQGGEQVTFQFGLLGADKKYSDTAQGKLPTVTLTKEWKQYSIPLKGKDLSRVKTGFCWVAAGQGKPITFYLDDIQYE